MTTDLKLVPSGPVYDLEVDLDGDIANGNFLDSAILYAIFGEKRASPSEVPVASRRRGWIGNEGKDFENGSKVWLFEQARRTQSTLNELGNAIEEALQYLVEDEFLSRITVRVFIEDGSTKADIELFRFNSKSEHRYFTLWENTGSTL